MWQIDPDVCTTCGNCATYCVLDESAVGFIVTDGDPSSNLNNSLLGVDFRYLNTRLAGGGVIEGDAWFQQSDTEGLSGADSAFGLGIGMPNRAGLRGSVSVKEIERNFKPALGYINRSNVRDMNADIGFTHFLNGNFLLSAYSGIDAQRISFLDGGLQSQSIVARILELDTQTRGGFEARYHANREVVLDAFTIYEDLTRAVAVPPGDYSFDEYSLSASTASFRTVSGSFTYRNGDFFDGTKRSVALELVWNQSSKFKLDFSYDWNDIDLPDGRFITRLLGLTTEINFSSRLSWINLIQYDNVSEIIGINSRLHWIPRAGQEGFIILNHNLQDIDKNDRFQSSLSDLSVKFNYTFRF